ncbi:carbon-nitrogen hydrolase family protein [Gulosibacter massiliensis]|uniref:carbon-nitrogen hydrolase family protein n=1 Tax=Gulosibacter massiliensis TaxID=2479839 RepID=UPI000F641AD7|nr:carbon-nitrogen hydrolase family protein [Gulosibacter massiliensis]
MSEAIACAVSQFAPTLDTSKNLRLLRDHLAIATDRGARMFVAPEYSSGFDRDYGDWMHSVAQPLDGEFATALGQLAAEFGVTLVAGMLEQVGDGVANTLVAFGDTGELLAAYRKVHLYDAFAGRESAWLTAGDPSEQPAVFEAYGLTIGLQTCYDLRFPESSRRLVDAGADVLAVPAEWVRGPLKEHHWRTLLSARAIENVAYVVAADHPAPTGVGGSSVVDPRGVTIATLGTDTGVAMAWLDPAEVAAARDQNPALRLRKYTVRASD